MFDLTNEKMAEHKAKEMFANMLIESILTSESAPEHVKLSVHVISKARDISNATSKIIGKYVTPGKEANAETLKNVLEYLELVEVGIKQFFETTPFVANTEEE